MAYANFDLSVTQDGNQYRIAARYGAGGETTEFQPAAPDLTAADLHELNEYINGQAAQLDPQTAERAGAILRHWLFKGEIWTQFVESFGAAQRDGKGLRIRLRLEPSGLRRLPWEYCYDPVRYAKFLARDRRSPIVRYLEQGVLPGKLQRDQAARLLLAYSVAPDDAVAWQAAEEELVRIQTELADLVGQQRVAIHSVAQVTWDSLQQAINTYQPDMLHLVTGSELAQDGARLVLYDVKGQRAPQTAKQMKTLLGGTVKVVVLSTARGGVAAGQANLALAEALALAEIPAVVALHREMPTAVAGRFAASFYRYLALGNPLERAVTEMRIAIVGYDETAWGIPMLLMRSEDGLLWSDTPPGAPAAAAEPVSPFAAFMHLNYGRQMEVFDAMLAHERVCACLLHSEPPQPDSLQLLLKRLLLAVPGAGNTPVYRLDLASAGLDHDPEALWRWLGKRVGVALAAAEAVDPMVKGMIAGNLVQKLKSRHQVFIFSNVDESLAGPLVREFWLPLAKLAQNAKQLPQSRYLLVAFFVDPGGKVAQSGGLKLATVDPAGPQWQPLNGTPVQLEPVNRFVPEELQGWLESQSAAALWQHLADQALDPVQETLSGSNQGTADDVLWFVVNACDLESSGAFFDNWLKG